MSKLQKSAFRTTALFAVLFVFLTAAFNAQTPSPTPAPEPQQPQNPFALQQGPPLPKGMTGSNPADPRSKLTPGLFDAGEAAFGLNHILLLKKPDAFELGVDPEDPRVGRALRSMGIPDPAMIPATMRMGIAGLALGNSDIAFQGNHLFLGNFYGINIYDISEPAKTSLVTSMLCPGGQGDVSVHKNLMFMSVEMPNGRIDCGTEGFPPATNPQQQGMPAANKDRFRGVRIFDISDIQNPKQIAAVQTCRGSHTHTLLVPPDDSENVYVYVSGTSFVRPAEELAGCSGGKPEDDPETALFRIEVIKVPLAAPQDAKIVSEPRIFGDDKKINALTDGGSHEGDGRPVETNQCHDITVYPEIGLAAGACAGNGILLDIRDPANPKRIDSVNDPNYAYWHSASFSNDGKKVVFTDEWGGGMGPRCRENDPNKWGANAIFNLADSQKLHFASYYKMPAAQTPAENCVAHNGSLVPVPGRDIKIQAWYQGGISIMDFTDPREPVEIGYFDRGPIDDKMLVMGGTWSAYWYNGAVYSSEIARGLDVLELTPTKFLSQNEIDAAKAVMFDQLNVQAQERIEWPKTLTVAKAYIDQLERSRSLSAKRVKELRKAIGKAEDKGMSEKEKTKLGKIAAKIEKDAAKAKDVKPIDAERTSALVAILNAPTE